MSQLPKQKGPYALGGLSSNTLSPLEKAELDLCNAHLYYFRNLRKYGPNLFEENGDIILVSKDGKSKRSMNGRELILQTLKYFEDKDHSYFYRWCAVLKRVLDDYDERFPIS